LVFPACKSVRTFQVPKLITLFVSLLHNLRHFREDSPVSISSSQRLFFFPPGQSCRPSAQPPTWGTRVSLFVWVITLDLSGMGDPTSSISYRQHSSRVHVTAQAPPLRQSRDTIEGVAVNSPPSNDEVGNERSCTSTPSLYFFNKLRY
jgi:hypothetical protein